MSKRTASLAHAIHSFQSGDLSHNELFAQVDRALANNQANSARLLEILGDEQTRVQLPPDVYAELHRRVEHLTDQKPPADNDATRVQNNRSRNRGDRSTTHSVPPRFSDEPLNEEPERMKGIGDTLNGRFVLEECIGFGGMGTVYRALDPRKL